MRLLSFISLPTSRLSQKHKPIHTRRFKTFKTILNERFRKQHLDRKMSVKLPMKSVPNFFVIRTLQRIVHKL